MISTIAKQATKFASDNSPAILTSIGVVGAVTTAVLAAQGGFKAALYLDEVRLDREAGYIKTAPLTLKDKSKLTWMYYLPAAGTTVLTCGVIIAAHTIGGRRTAAVAAAFTLSERTLNEYKDKVVEKFGDKKAREVHDEIMQDRVNQVPVPTHLHQIASGKVIFFDSWSGRYWESSMEDVKKAMNDLNYKVLNSFDNSASLTDFYNLLGLPPLQGSDEFGWNADKLLEIDITTCTYVNPSGVQIPAFAIYYMVEPKRDYFRR